MKDLYLYYRNALNLYFSLEHLKFNAYILRNIYKHTWTTFSVNLEPFTTQNEEIIYPVYLVISFLSFIWAYNFDTFLIHMTFKQCKPLWMIVFWTSRRYLITCYSPHYKTPIFTFVSIFNFIQNYFFYTTLTEKERPCSLVVSHYSSQCPIVACKEYILFITVLNASCHQVKKKDMGFFFNWRRN